MLYDVSKLARAVALGLSLAVSAGSAGAQDLTISVYGGGYGELWKKLAVDPYVAETGQKVVVDMGPATQRLTKLLTTRGGGVDLMILTDHMIYIAKERGVLEPVNTANIPNSANLLDVAKDPMGGGLCPAITILGVGLAYNRNLIKEPPKTWDILTRSDLPAPQAFMDMAFSMAPSMLVKLSELRGGGPNNVEPGLKLMADLKNRAKFFKLFEVLDWINRGEVSVAPMLNTFVKEDPNVPLAFTWPEKAIGAVNLACVVKGSKNKAAAEKFINYYLQEKVQVAMAKAFGETPVLKQVTLPNDIPFKVLTPAMISTMTFYDPNVIGANRPKWTERFEEMIVAR